MAATASPRTQPEAHAPQEDDVRVTRGSGNVYRDLLLEDPEEALLQFKLVKALRQAVKARGLKPAQVVEALGLDRATIAELLRGHAGDLPSGEIMALLATLGLDVEVTIRPKGGDEGRVSVLVAREV